jgi:hypothetical protein
MSIGFQKLLLALTLVVAPTFAADTPAAKPAASSVTAPSVSAPRSTSKPAAPLPSPRNDSSVAPSASFDSFRLISDRNIFNPNRTGRRDRSEEKAPRLDVISLVGTMDSDRGLRAFFDGSENAYRKALRAGDSIDKFKVKQITANVVDLERDGKTVSMRVGQQLRRPEGGDWDLVGEDVVRREALAREAAKVDPNAPPVIPADASDTVRKMMEARAKQLKP